MSRIQEILSKAERDGTARRTRSLSSERDGGGAAVAVPPRAPQPALERPPTPAWTPAATAPAIEPPVASAIRDGEAVLDPHVVAALAPQSLAAEQYRLLRTRIKRVENGRSMRLIVVTSPSKGDGKSLTAANLAVTMAQEFQQRVLLLDADLRRPTVHHMFGVSEGPGLTDILLGGVELDQALVYLGEQHLTVLPAGTPPSHPAELLGSAAMRRLLDTLRSRFDRVLIDMPPVEPLADLQILAPVTDGLLMIVRAGVTPRPAIERALSGLDMSKVLGLVLNETGSSAADRENYGGYGYIGG